MTTKPRQSPPLSFYLAVGAAVLCVVAVMIILVRALTVPPLSSQGVGGQAFQSGEQPGILGQGDGARGLHIQIMDRDDRSRLSAELRTETIEPLQAQRYSVTKPRATMYLEDGRVVHISATDGTLVMPDRTKAPETGTLTGTVVVRLFDVPTGGGSPNPGRDEPSFTWRGTSLTFDSTLGEASTNEPFVLASRDFEFNASDAKLLFNQALERLERFTVRQGGKLVYFTKPEPSTPPDNPTEPADGADAGRVARQAQPAGKPNAAGQPPRQAAAQTPAESVETFYQAAMRSGVVLEHSGQRIQADRLDLFARTIDNKLPPDAITGFEPGASDAPSAPDEPGAAAPGAPRPDGSAGREQPTEVAQADPDSAPRQPADDATLTWTGVLEVRPLSAEPPELKENHLAARFTSEQTGVVSFSDAVSESSGQAAMVEYAFTTQRLTLSGPSQESSVFITSPSMGRASMGRLELPLATGVALIPGPFSVVGADGVSKIDARERSELHFAMHNGRLTGELLEAIFVGSARAADEDASLKAQQLHAYFQPDADGQSRLTRLLAEENVDLDDGKGAGGRCDSLDTRFAAGADDPVPESFTAAGNVHFRDQTGKIDTQHLHALLRQDESGDIEVDKAWAEGGVLVLRHTDQITITGQRLFADTDAQFIEVEHGGGQARVARGPTVIAGEMVRLNGSVRTALVEGAGMFEHRAGRGEQASHVLASWTEGMAFDDGAGRLECLGDVDAVHEPDPLTRETISAELVRVQLDPAGETPEAIDADDALALETIGSEDRAIRTVYAAGRAYFGVGDELATVESARYAPGADAAADTEGAEAPKQLLERAFRLSGVEIISDNQAGTLDVPGRGRLFVADLRSAPEGEEASADRGAALFDWRGSLHADRALGAAEMLEAVQMNHTSTTDGSKAFLECARLRIRFAPGEGDDELFGGLRSAIADTDVYLRTDARELTSDLLEYNPDTGIARALAEDFGSVQILDRATGSPMTAAAIVWNLTTDRVDVVDPGTISIPR